MNTLTEKDSLRDLMETRYASVQVPGLVRRVVDLSQSEGWILVSFKVEPILANRAGFVQGGICATMLESSMSMAGAVKSCGAMSMPMVEFKVSLMRPVSVGLLTVRAEVVRMGRTLAFAEASMMDVHGQLLARATGIGVPKAVVDLAEN